MKKTNFPAANKKISRGKFIRNSLVTTAGFYIVPRHVLGGRGYTAPSDKLYIAAKYPVKSNIDPLLRLISSPFHLQGLADACYLFL